MRGVCAKLSSLTAEWYCVNAGGCLKLSKIVLKNSLGDISVHYSNYILSNLAYDYEKFSPGMSSTFYFPLIRESLSLDMF